MAIGIVSARDLVAERSGRFAGLVIIDARRKTAFLEGHIPRALPMAWESWCEAAPHEAGPILVQEGNWGVVAPITPVRCGERLTSLGLRDDRPILVYADGPRTRGREGRIAWMLLYFGARDVLLLDGGWSAWMAADGAVVSYRRRASGTRTTRALTASFCGLLLFGSGWISA